MTRESTAQQRGVSSWQSDLRSIPSVSRWVTRYSSSGQPYQAQERGLPRISDHFLNCVVYLYPSEAEAQEGKNIGGSGFLVGIPLDEQQKRFSLFVVTNKHVVDHGNMTVRINTRFGETDIISLEEELWFAHPDGDDLAICGIGLSSELHQVDFIRPDHWVDKEWIKETDIGPGDDVFVVGRFISRDGQQQNRPTVRFGNIAQMPGDPIVTETGHKQESFLVEIRSMSGYSGSPVFVRYTTHVTPPGAKKYPYAGILVQGFGLLLGVDFCHIHSREPVIDNVTKRPVNPDWYVSSNTGMAGIIPAWKLADIFENEELKRLIEEVKVKQKNRLQGEVTRLSSDTAQTDRPQKPDE